MPVRVSIEYADEVYSSVFTSKAAFITQLRNDIASGHSLLRPFGRSNISTGSDNRDYIEMENGDDFIEFVQVQRAFEKGDYAAFVDRVFTYVPVDTPAPVSSRRVRNQINPARGFLNNSNRVSALKTVLKDERNWDTITELMEDTSCHVKYDDGIWYRTREQIVGFYMNLSCMFIGLELRLVDNPLVRWFRKMLGLTDEFNELKTWPVCNMLRYGNSLSYQLRKCIGKGSLAELGYACTTNDIEMIAKEIQMDIYVVKEKEYMNAVSAFGSTGLTFRSFDGADQLYKGAMNGRLSYVEKYPGATADRIKQARDHAIIMRMTDQFDKYSHLEIVHDPKTTNYIIKGQQLHLFTNLNLNKCGGVPDTIVDDAKYDVYKSYNIDDRINLNPKKNCLSPGVPITCVHVKTLDDLKGVINSMNNIKSVVDGLRGDLKSKDKDIRRDALNTIQSACPSLVTVDPLFFSDHDVKCEIGTVNHVSLLSVMSYVYEYTIVNPKDGYKTTLVSLLPIASNSELRKAAVINSIRMEKGTHKPHPSIINGISSATFVIDVNDDNSDDLAECPIPRVRFMCRGDTPYEMGLKMFTEGRNDIPFVNRAMHKLEVMGVHEQYAKLDERERNNDRYKKELKKPPTIDPSSFIDLNEHNSIIHEIVSGSIVSKVMGDLKVYNYSASSILEPVLGVEPAPIEKLKVYKYNLCEPSVARGYDTTSFDTSTKEIALVDFSKQYGSISMGAFSKVYKSDYYDERMVFGGYVNNVPQAVDGPLLSYNIDNGHVFIEGSKIKWDELQRMAPNYLNIKCSYYAWLRCAKYVEVYMVIHLCAVIADINKAYPRDERLVIYKKVQELLGIKMGVFVFDVQERKMLHKIWSDNEHDKLKDVSHGMQSIMNGFMQPHYHRLFNSNGQPVDGRRAAGKTPRSNFYRLAMLISRTFHILSKYCNNDQKVLKRLMNSWIGQMKNGQNGGVNTYVSMDNLMREDKDGNLSVYMEDKPISNNTTMSVVHLPTIPRHYICMQTRTSITPKRYSMFPFRNYIINTGAVAMNELSEKTESYRNYVDSVAIDVSKVDIAKNWFERMLPGTSGLVTMNTFKHFAPGYMPPYSVDIIDLDKPTTNDFAPGQETLEPKYNIFKYPGNNEKKHEYDVKVDELVEGYKHYTHGDEFKYIETDGKLCEYNRKMLDEIHNDWTTVNASDVLWDVLGSRGMRWNFESAHHAHRELLPLCKTDESIRDMYNEFNNKFVEMVAKEPCVIYGAPGCGKTHTFQGISRVFEKQNKVVAAASQMHSVARVCRGAGIKESHTMHHTFGTLLDVKGAARNPKTHIARVITEMRRFKWDVLIIDEAETVDIKFEELVKAAYEMGKIIYISGDVHQSAPMMGTPGFRMFGSVSHYICGGRRVHCDLQFRNSDIAYQDTLTLASKGQISKYTDKSMVSYTQSVEFDPYDMMDIEYLEELHKDGVSFQDQLDKVADQIVNGNPVTRSFANSSYKVGVCIVTDILRRVMVKTNGEFVKGSDVIMSMSKPRDPSTSYKSYYVQNIFKEVTKIKQKDHGMSWNGPSSKKMMDGVPLILKRGVQFTSTDKFKSMYDGRMIEKAETYTVTGRSKYKVMLIPLEENIQFKRHPNGKRVHEEEEKETKYTKIKCYEFSCGRKRVYMNASEVSVNLIYSFSIQREFVIGCTMKSLSVVQPVIKGNKTAHYTSIKKQLESMEERFGSQSVLTDIARTMRVMVTRVTEVGNTDVFDLTVPDKYFWQSVMTHSPQFMTTEYYNDSENEQNRFKNFIGKVTIKNYLYSQVEEPDENDPKQSSATINTYPKFPARYLEVRNDYNKFDI